MGGGFSKEGLLISSIFLFGHRSISRTPQSPLACCSFSFLDLEENPMNKETSKPRVESAEPAGLVVDRDGIRLDSWLAEALDLPRSEAARMAEHGRVLVEGSPASKSTKLRAGQIVTVEELPGRRARSPRAVFDIRYEDEHLAVIAKPAGVVVHPAPGTSSETLVEALRRQMPLAEGSGAQRPGIVHRLDKQTSGLLVVAKTDTAFEGLSAAIKERKVERRYVALVLGRIDVTTGRIEAPVGRSPKDRTRMGVGGGRAAVTEFRVARNFGPAGSTGSPGAALLELRLLSGRTHQIRVHMSHIGHPIVGDSSYGRKAAALAKDIGLNRPFLHASKLAFVHPVTSSPIAVEEPLPVDLTSALQALETITASGPTRRK